MLSFGQTRFLHYYIHINRDEYKITVTGKEGDFLSNHEAKRLNSSRIAEKAILLYKRKQ